MGRLKALVAALAVALSTVVVGVAAPAPAGAVVNPTPSFDPTNRAQVWSAYETSLLEAQGVPTGWTGSTASCTNGTESAASITATRAAVNFYRELNNLPAITFDTAKNATALGTALLMEANGTLNHHPPSTWSCWNQARDDGAALSNLNQGATGAGAVDSYISDLGDNNTEVGHRRWVLYPLAGTFGTGSTRDFNALHVLTGHGTTRPAGVSWVTWPSAGYVPRQAFRPRKSGNIVRFSASNNQYPSADYSAATMTVKIGSTTLTAVKQPLSDGTYGDNTLVYDVSLPAGFDDANADVKFDVTVTGAKQTAGGTTIPAYGWSSTIINTNGGAQTVPGVPTNVTAVPGNQEATISWAPPTNYGGTPVSGYQVQVFANGTPSVTWSFGWPATTQTILGLTNGVSYTFKVSAVNFVGTGAPSGASNAVTPPNGTASVPGAPTGANATPGNGQATVSWTAPTSNGGSAITGYRVTPYAGSTPLPERTFDASATTRAITGLTNNVGYSFRVQAVNAVGPGPQSAPTAVVVPVAGTPGAPGRPKIDNVSGTSVTLAWSPATTGGSPITGHAITAYIGGTAQKTVTYPSGARTQTISGLTAGATYTFRVRAINAVGPGAFSDASPTVTLGGGPAEYDPFDDYDDLITQTFQRMVGRAPTTSELATWRTNLQGSGTPGTLAASLRTSNTHTTVVDPVARLYWATFERIPDRSGLEYWIAQRKGGRSIRSIADFFTTSNEFRQSYGNLTNAQFVNQVYLNVLGRPADASGSAYWTGELNAGRRSRGSVMLGFSESPEYKAQKDTEVTVAVLYIQILRRSPTAGELSSGVTAITSTSVAAFATTLLETATPD